MKKYENFTANLENEFIISGIIGFPIHSYIDQDM